MATRIYIAGPIMGYPRSEPGSLRPTARSEPWATDDRPGPLDPVPELRPLAATQTLAAER